MSHYVDRYWAQRRMREVRKFSEFNCLDPDPRNNETPEIEDDEIPSAEIAALKLETHAMRHTPRLSDEYGE